MQVRRCDYCTRVPIDPSLTTCEGCGAPIKLTTIPPPARMLNPPERLEALHMLEALRMQQSFSTSSPANLDGLLIRIGGLLGGLR